MQPNRLMKISTCHVSDVTVRRIAVVGLNGYAAGKAAGERARAAGIKSFLCVNHLMIVKVKEPRPAECTMLRAGQILYTYLHLAPNTEQTPALIQSKAVCTAALSR